MAGLIVYFAVTSLLVVGASEYAQEFIDDQVRHDHHSPPPGPLPPAVQRFLPTVLSHRKPLLQGPVFNSCVRCSSSICTMLIAADAAPVHGRAGYGQCTARLHRLQAARRPASHVTKRQRRHVSGATLTCVKTAAQSVSACTAQNMPSLQPEQAHKRERASGNE